MAMGDLGIRFVTGLPLAAAVFATMLYGPPLVVGAVVIVMSVMGMRECVRMFENIQIQLPRMLLMGSAALISVSVLTNSLGLFNAAFCLSLFLVLGSELLLKPSSTMEEASSLGPALFALLWIPWSASHITLLRFLPDGFHFLIIFIFVTWFSDSFAYLAGKSFGRTLLAQHISPKKTIEGSLGGVFGAAAFAGTYLWFFVESLDWWHGALIGAALAVIGQLGDLIESKIKRLCQVKDSGTLIPGHGGILDRVDALLFTAPPFYYFMSVIVDR